MNRSISNHIVICNWSPKAEYLLQELRSDVIEVKRPVVVVSERPHEIPQSTAPEFDLVFVVPGDPLDERVLRRANIATCDTAVVLADRQEGEFADMKSLLVAMAIEAVEPRVYTVVELLQSSSRHYFQHTHADELVCDDELTEKLLAQTVVTRSASLIYEHLLTATRETNEIYKVPVPRAFINRPYRELEETLLDDETLDLIPLGFVTQDIKRRGGRTLVNHHGHELAKETVCLNPVLASDSRVVRDRQYKLKATDRLVVMAYDYPDELETVERRKQGKKRGVHKQKEVKHEA